MNSILVSPKNFEANHSPKENGSDERAIVLQELEQILTSRYFKSADRSKQFLRFVVLNKLDGHTERLKERTIGTEVFQRPLGYATGDDPVVRVQAGEVRRRLEQYYRDALQPSHVRLELPVGSYSPIFHWEPAPAVREAQTRVAVLAPVMPAPRWRALLKIAAVLAFVACLIFGTRALFFSPRSIAADPKSNLEEFWGPAIASQQPVLICIANATDHSAAEKFLQAQLKAGASEAAIRSLTMPLATDSSQKLTDEGLPISPEIVPASDSSVAFALSGLFGRLHRPSQLRIGAAATYEDLRNFPAVIVGGFNSKWTMQLVSNLHFAFLRENGQYMIREEVAGGRVWTTQSGPHGETLEDFAIVARLVDSKTGQFTVTVAGIGPRGTQAAGEFVTSARYLEEGLAGAPAGWQNRNLEILLQTSVTDSMAGPPRVIGTYAW
jgi:hypothetical protein